MRFLIQNVKEASVTVDHQVIGKIQKGFVVLIGISDTDNKEIADKLIQKLLKLRIFKDEKGKTNLSLTDVQGELLLISQFTLYADCRHGNRPGFTKAGNPRMANDLYEYIIRQCQKTSLHVETGSFGADMDVALINDGPFTIMLDSEEF